ncbi:hypothetical protein KUCAC02_031401 [Chaenocephalus aceratus]|nr:hypothetical protein KUCAC02_031401 [Chaenocephalus aceratus]
MADTLYSHGIVVSKNIEEMVDRTVCATEMKACAYGDCVECRLTTHPTLKSATEEIVQVVQWSTERTGEEERKTITLKKEVQSTESDLVSTFQENLFKFPSILPTVKAPNCSRKGKHFTVVPGKPVILTTSNAAVDPRPDSPQSGYWPASVSISTLYTLDLLSSFEELKVISPGFSRQAFAKLLEHRTKYGSRLCHRLRRKLADEKKCLNQEILKYNQLYTEILSCEWATLVAGMMHGHSGWLLDEDPQSLVPEGMHIIGDSAYPLLPQLMRPYRDNGHLTARQRRFNQKLNVARVVIEHTFGLLKTKFRRLKCLYMKNIANISTAVTARCILHNMCLEEGEATEVDEQVEAADNRAPHPQNQDAVLHRNQICDLF